ncbi:hypothetical protein ES703_119677 [subsurface metagenome]
MVVVVRPAATSTTAKIAMLTLHHHAKVSPPEVVSGPQAFSPSQAANFINNRHRLIVKKSYLRVRRLPVIVQAEPPTNADCFGGNSLLANRPSALVNIVGTEIADLPGTCIPKPVPIIVQVLPHQGHQWSRSLEEVVVHRCRDGLRPIDFANTLTEVVADCPDEFYRAKVTLFYIRHGCLQPYIGAVL